MDERGIPRVDVRPWRTRPDRPTVPRPGTGHAHTALEREVRRVFPADEPITTGWSITTITALRVG